VDDIVGLRFQLSGDIVFFLAGDLDPRPGEWVVVEAESGPVVGLVAIAASQMIHSSLSGPLPSILRMATQEDFASPSSIPRTGAILLDVQLESGLA
jgi:cell fate regulator YaaT (PSP1 superfamily)